MKRAAYRIARLSTRAGPIDRLPSGPWDTAAIAEAVRARAEKREPVFPDLAPLRYFTDGEE